MTVAAIMLMLPELQAMKPEALAIGVNLDTGELMLHFISAGSEDGQVALAPPQAVLQLHQLLHHLVNCPACGAAFKNLEYTPEKHLAH